MEDSSQASHWATGVNGGAHRVAIVSVQHPLLVERTGTSFVGGNETWVVRVVGLMEKVS